MDRGAAILFTVFFVIIVMVVAATAFVLTFAFANERSERDTRVPGQYIVVFDESVFDADEVEEELLLRTRGERIASYRSAIRGFAGRIAPDQLDALARDPRVLFISEDRVVSIDTERSRPAREERGTRSGSELIADVASTAEAPTGLDRIDADGLENTGEGVHIAVIDTGIYKNHPELSGNIAGGMQCTNEWWEGYDDQNGHGTHVAGTIAAKQNTSGVVGVAPNAKLWAVKVLDRNGNGTWSSVICGIDFVASHAPQNGGPIQVANLSLGGFGVSDNNCGNTNNDALHRAICRLRDAGVVVVAAAGNSGSDAAMQVPAAYDDAVITVSALADSDGSPGGEGPQTSYGADDTFATFSNWGAPVDIAAPGVGIYSTWLYNQYATLSGTSMAAPHVSGAAALFLTRVPKALWTEVKEALVSSGERLGEGHADPSGRHREPVLQIDALSLLWQGQTPAPPEPPSEEPPPPEETIPPESGEEPPPEESPPSEEPKQEYFESFEGDINDVPWTQGNRMDWGKSLQRATDGEYSLEVDGRVRNSMITSDVIDIFGATNAIVSFDWYIEKKLDSGEYIAFDVSVDGGSTWEESARLRGNVDEEDVWHSEHIEVSGISSLRVRFRAFISGSAEDANVDSVRILAR